jgi:hypothetical protein
VTVSSPGEIVRFSVLRLLFDFNGPYTIEHSRSSSELFQVTVSNVLLPGADAYRMLGHLDALTWGTVRALWGLGCLGA